MRNLNRKIDSVLFDLDGTLLDTYRDLCGALNCVLEACGHPPLDHSKLRPFVSKGAMVMICIAFQCRPDSIEAKLYWEQMLQFYEQEIATHTKLFPGMEDVLKFLQHHKIKWGIVTNKPGYLTEQLLAKIDWCNPPQCVVSGDTLEVKKPHPEPLLFACRTLGSIPAKTVYVGDDEQDIIAGKNAEMLTVSVEYGYHTDDDLPMSWGADYTIEKASNLLSWLS